MLFALAVALTLSTQALMAAPVARDGQTGATMRGLTTPIDWAIDATINMRTAAQKLAPAEIQLAREQLQLRFLSLSAAQRDQIVAATRNVQNEEGVLRAMQMLDAVVVADARNTAADLREKALAAPAPEDKGVQKLGTNSSDLVFVGTPGPCRVADTRVLGSKLAANSAIQLYAYSSAAGFDWASQGGSGIAGSGNCAGDVFAGAAPLYVVATLTATNTTSTGALRAWDGTPALTVGAALAWVGGDMVSNTTVIPLNRTGAIFAGSGNLKKDFGVYNNSGAAIDVVVDVVGFFINNTATPLDCTAVVDTQGVSLGAGSTFLLTAPQCPAGYTAIMGQPQTGAFGVNAGTIRQNVCRINNTTASPVQVFCDALCCRLPGL